MRLRLEGRKRLERARLPAVDDHASARYPARPAAGKERDEVADFVGGAESAERDLTPHELRDGLAILPEAALPRAALVQDAVALLDGRRPPVGVDVRRGATLGVGPCR